MLISRYHRIHDAGGPVKSKMGVNFEAEVVGARSGQNGKSLTDAGNRLF